VCGFPEMLWQFHSYWRLPRRNTGQSAWSVPYSLILKIYIGQLPIFSCTRFSSAQTSNPEQLHSCSIGYCYQFKVYLKVITVSGIHYIHFFLSHNIDSHSSSPPPKSVTCFRMYLSFSGPQLSEHMNFMLRPVHLMMTNISAKTCHPLCNDYNKLSRYSDSLQAGQPWFHSLQGQEIFIISTAYRMALGPTQPPIQWVPKVISSGVKGPGHEANQLLTSI
jgi:hypothetical protein